MKFTRRELLESVAVAVLALGAPQLSEAFWHGSIVAPPPYDPTVVNVFEITMAAPDIICVEVRDGIRQVGNYQISGSSYGTPSMTVYSGSNPGTGVNYYTIQNIGGTARRWFDARSTQILNLSAALVAGNYGAIGAQTVTAVYHQDEPFDQVLTQITGPTQWLGGGFSHYLFLKLSGALSNGNYSISFPSGTGLGSYTFNYNDKKTRAFSIAASQVGHRPDDGCKLAYLRAPVPGYPSNYASIKFADYGLTDFYIIDSSGTVQFTGTSGIVQRMDPTTVGTDTTNVDYTDTSQPPFILASMTKANPGLAGYSGTGWAIANGDKVRFEFISGMTQLMNQGGGGSAKAYTVSNLDTGAKTFNIDQDTTAFSTLTTGTFFSPTVENSINKTYSGNSGGIYVYQMDYSAFNPGNTGQTYYVYVPGVGVSYPFVISDTVYNSPASVTCGGYYNQLIGTALDGRFGYTRPVSFRDGQNGVVINWSYMPAAWSSEWSFASPGYPSSGLGTATWQTSTRQTGLFGEYFDAGDWDCAAYAHGLMVYCYLDIYEFISNPNTNFGFPKSTASIDPTVYAGTDFMGDLAHQAFWWLNFYNSTMQSDGSCASGMGYSDGGGAPDMYEASCYSYHTPWLYAADIIDNYMVAAVNAKAASVMFNAYAANPGVSNLLTLGNYFFSQAGKAWTWAEGIFQSNSANGGDGTVQDAYYQGVLDLQTKAGWSGAQYTAAMTSIVNASGSVRLMAAGCLFRASSLQPGGSPNTTYSTIVEAPYALVITSYTGHAAWEYCWANYSSSTHTTQKNYYFGVGHGWPAQAASSQVTGPGTTSYFGIAPAIRDGCMNTIRAIIVAQTPGFTAPTSVARLYAYMQGLQGFWWGTNQIGWSFTSGIGKRWKRNILVRDKEALALSDMMPGITAYTLQIGEWPSGGLDGAATDGSNFWAQGNNRNADPPYNAGKTIYPSLYARRQQDGGLDNSYFINWSEFTTEQCIAPMQIWTMWLNAR